MVDDAERRELFEALESSLGPGPATTLMELLPPVGWADVARRSDLVAIGGEMAELRGELKGEMAGLRGEMAELRADLKADMAGLRTELKGEMAELRSTVDRQFVKLVVANVPMMFATAGLVLAAAKLA